MKNISISVLFFTLIVFVGCSKDDTSTVETSKNESFLFQKEASSEVKEFLDSFYNNDYDFGESVETIDDKSTYIITEIIIGSAEVSRGYIVTDKYSGKLLYFADVDRINYILKAFDFANNDVDTFLNINNLNEYNNSGGFDILKMVNEANTNPSGKVGRFWGWSCGNSYSIELNSCYRTCCYRTAWIQSSCDTFSCSNLPGSNPAIPN